MRERELADDLLRDRGDATIEVRVVFEQVTEAVLDIVHAQQTVALLVLLLGRPRVCTNEAEAEEELEEAEEEEEVVVVVVSGVTVGMGGGKGGEYTFSPLAKKKRFCLFY